MKTLFKLAKLLAPVLASLVLALAVVPSVHAEGGKGQTKKKMVKKAGKHKRMKKAKKMEKKPEPPKAEEPADEPSMDESVSEEM